MLIEDFVLIQNQPMIVENTLNGFRDILQLMSSH